MPEWMDENGIGWRIDARGVPEPINSTLVDYYERQEMIIRTCGWCHADNRVDGPGPVWCRTCGHRADVARLECDCGRLGCRPPGGA